MYKSLIAGVTAFALAATAASPIQAQSTDQDAFAKFLFGLVAAAAVGSAIKNRRSNNDRNAPPELIAPEHNTHSPGDDRNRGRRNLRRQDSPSDNRNWNNPGRALGHRRDATLLPTSCLRSAETRFGRHRIFEQNCLEREFRHAAALPNDCRVRIFTTDRRARRGYDPACLRSYGYRVRRN